MTTLQNLETEKIELRLKVKSLIELKDELFSNVDIETPMCNKEKELTRGISNIYSRINQIVGEKRNLLRK